MQALSGANAFALRWLDAVIAVPVWMLAALLAAILIGLLLALRPKWRWWATAPLAAGLAAVAIWQASGLAWSERADAIEARLASWRAQATAAHPVLACLDTQVDAAVDAACERSLFAKPEHLAAATAYLGQSINLLADAQQYGGPRSVVFERDLERLRTALERDRFGLVANLLMVEEGCSVHRCDALLLFADPTAVQENIAKRTAQKHIARYLDEPAAKAAPVATRAENPDAPLVAAPLPPNYVLPSSNSIPAISIMKDEPKEPAPSASRAPAPSQPAAKPPAPRTRAAAAHTVELKPLALSQ